MLRLDFVVSGNVSAEPGELRPLRDEVEDGISKVAKHRSRNLRHRQRVLGRERNVQQGQQMSQEHLIICIDCEREDRQTQPNHDGDPEVGKPIELRTKLFVTHRIARREKTMHQESDDEEK